MSDFVEFVAEQDVVVQNDDRAPWVIAVIDDEPAVFEATRIALEGTNFEGRPISIVYAASAAEGRRLLAEQPDIACLLLDVVMETEHAGLDLVRYIREQMGNESIRIILRTGQPGYAPPMDVIRRYDINDYKEKSELTQMRLWTAVVCALRSYQQITALDTNRRGLRMVIESSAELMERRGIDEFACGVVTQIAAHLNLRPDGLVCVRQAAGNEAIVVGAAGKFADSINKPLVSIGDDRAISIINRVLENQREVSGRDHMGLFIAAGDWTGVIYINGRTEVCPLDRELLQLYCHNVALGFDNVRLFEAVSDTAYVDRMTLLPTRARLEETIERLMRSPRRLGVLLVDIDRFANYTTFLGNEFSRNLLRALAARLTEVQPLRDRVACLFGDVFAIVLEGSEIDDPAQWMDRIQRPLAVGDRTLWVSLSFGFAQVPDDERLSGQELIHRGEVALNKAKQARSTALITFSPEVEVAQRAHVLLAHDLRDALVTDQISLRFQPQVHIGSGRTIGAEALVRWNHPSLGAISPTEFIPIAEASGSISDLGQWVARRACRDLRPVLEAGLIDRLTINLSPVQLRNPDCLTELHAVVEGEGLNPSAIEWEVTESAVVDSESAVAQLEWASGLGYSIALDDFGTGHSSLSMIRALPLDVVKIDRSFLLEVTSDRRARTVLRLIASVCEELGLSTIAEGVESEDQLRVVQAANIGNVQGFLYAKPLILDDLLRWLHQRPN